MTRYRNKDYQLVCSSTSQVLLEPLLIANTFWSRFLGLQGQKDLEPSAGLLLVPCGSVHTCFMRFSLDLVMLDRKGTVLKIVEGVKPWKVVSKAKQTYAVIEVKEGSGRHFKAGERVCLRQSRESEKGSRGIPPSLAFLLSEFPQ